MTVRIYHDRMLGHERELELDEAIARMAELIGMVRAEQTAAPPLLLSTENGPVAALLSYRLYETLVRVIVEHGLEDEVREAVEGDARALAELDGPARDLGITLGPRLGQIGQPAQPDSSS